MKSAQNQQTHKMTDERQLSNNPNYSSVQDCVTSETTPRRPLSSPFIGSDIKKSKKISRGTPDICF